MKKLFSGVMAFLALNSLVLVLFPEALDASVSRTNTASFSYSRSRTNPNSTVSNVSKGYRGTRVKQSGTEEAPSFTDAAETRALRTTTGIRKSSSLRVDSSAVSALVMSSFLANEVHSFFVELPQDFKKISDTLTWEDGSITFSGTNSNITITALGNICEGGTVFVQDCLNIQSDTVTDDIEKEWPAGIVLKKEIIQLRETGEYRFDQANAGKWFLLDTDDQRIGVLTFFDAEMKYLWQIHITAPDISSGILNNERILQKIKNSLFVPPVSKTEIYSRVVQRTQKSSSASLRSTATGKRTTVETFSSKDVTKYSAQQVPFEIMVPNGFSLVSDTLTRSSGSIVFEAEEGSIEIYATDAICSDQSFPVERECIEKFGTEEITQLKEQYPAMTSLGTENYRLQLTTNTDQNAVARGVLLMNGAERVSTIVFAEPVYGNMWHIDIVSNNGQWGLLGDARQFKKLITSLRFGN
jgi:hypothetical protein